VRREGRSMIYAARYEAMNGLIAFLTENCCRGAAETSVPAKSQPVKSSRKREHVV